MVHSQRGGKEALFVYEPASFVPLASIQGTQENRHTYWYQCDQIGAPLELTDAQGRIAWAADYKVWGEATLRTLARTGTDDAPVGRRIGNGPGVGWSEGTSDRSSALPHIEQPFRFQGQQFDEETGLHYNRFRYYDPAVGRFVSQDPIGLVGGKNYYEYGSNPEDQSDPWGLKGGKGKPRPVQDKSGRPTASPHYSLWKKLTIPCEILSGSREDHFRWANEQLHNMLQADPSLAKTLGQEVVDHVKPGPKGGVATTSPPGLTWHHSAQDPTQIELIPRGQHRSPGPVQETLHPNQQGGFKKLSCK
ncbi:RHS repeat-associated core domain-containing protein [Paracidovorax valerianellae]|uniref:RHS repeat-associated core domain-containing protein n=2 Tax=Paracidovorax valerianellae TaxID=187868 RepID=A0A1G7FKC5_9BURK|nr:RHS repeat-associated core domain-containing protein [Paracidovorax valerianellae]